jgi:hypothetical protein
VAGIVLPEVGTQEGREFGILVDDVGASGPRAGAFTSSRNEAERTAPQILQPVALFQYVWQHRSKSLLGKVGIESEGGMQMPHSHHLEAHAIHETQVSSAGGQ